jgi:hypothetical protein
MHILRSFVIFLIGAGFAAGAYVSGAADRLPYYINQRRHLRFADDGTLSLEPGASRPGQPVMLRVSSYGAADGQAGCEPAYRVVNETSSPVFFLWEPVGDPDAPGINAPRDIIKIPPGSTMVPSHGARPQPVGADSAQRCREQVEEIELGKR